MNKKAQGLPLRLIVIAAIAALVLVLIIAFTIGGFGAFFTKIFGTGQIAVGTEADTAKTLCNGYCNTAKASTTTTGWESSQYCTKTFDIDIDGDGELGDDETSIQCWESAIDVSCSTVIAGRNCIADATGCYCEEETTGNASE